MFFSGHRGRRTSIAGKHREIYLHINHNLNKVANNSDVKHSPAMQMTQVLTMQGHHNNFFHKICLKNHLVSFQEKSPNEKKFIFVRMKTFFVWQSGRISERKVANIDHLQLRGKQLSSHAKSPGVNLDQVRISSKGIPSVFK